MARRRRKYGGIEPFAMIERDYTPDEIATRLDEGWHELQRTASPRVRGRIMGQMRALATAGFERGGSGAAGRAAAARPSTAPRSIVSQGSLAAETGPPPAPVGSRGGGVTIGATPPVVSPPPVLRPTARLSATAYRRG